MKQLIAIAAIIMAFGAQAAEPAKAAASAPAQTNCVTKDKKGNCPPAPKSPKPTPKKKAASEAK